jgi:hypothetical protein
MTIEINGMAHIIRTVSRFEVARAFYGKLLPEFGMKPVSRPHRCRAASFGPPAPPPPTLL